MFDNVEFLKNHYFNFKVDHPSDSKVTITINADREFLTNFFYWSNMFTRQMTSNLEENRPASYLLKELDETARHKTIKKAAYKAYLYSKHHGMYLSKAVQKVAAEYGLSEYVVETRAKDIFDKMLRQEQHHIEMAVYNLKRKGHNNPAIRKKLKIDMSDYIIRRIMEANGKWHLSKEARLKPFTKTFKAFKHERLRRGY